MFTVYGIETYLQPPYSNQQYRGVATVLAVYGMLQSLLVS